MLLANWFTVIAYIAIAFYTFGYSKAVWKQKKRFAAVCISLVAFNLIVLSVAVLFYVT